jgi:hypothetical protein
VASGASERPTPEVGAEAPLAAGLDTGSNGAGVDAEAMEHCPAESNWAWLSFMLP